MSQMEIWKTAYTQFDLCRNWTESGTTDLGNSQASQNYVNALWDCMHPS